MTSVRQNYPGIYCRNRRSSPYVLDRFSGDRLFGKRVLAHTGSVQLPAGREGRHPKVYECTNLIAQSVLHPLLGDRVIENNRNAAPCHPRSIGIPSPFHWLSSAAKRVPAQIGRSEGRCYPAEREGRQTCDFLLVGYYLVVPGGNGRSIFDEKLCLKTTEFSTGSDGHKPSNLVRARSFEEITCATLDREIHPSHQRQMTAPRITRQKRIGGSNRRN